MPKVSVIVPVYNVEKCLSECVESILAQTFHDFELILVDDGSLDNSGKICDEYAVKDERIRVIHQENGGASDARHTGVKSALGDWICFVDSDDTIPICSLDILVNNSNDTDIVIGKIKESEDYDEHFPIRKYRSSLIEHSGFDVGPCGKLINRQLFNEYVFSLPRTINLGEDLIVNLRLSFNTELNVKTCNTIVYNYRQNERSLTHTYFRSYEYDKQYYRYLLQSIPERMIYVYSKSLLQIRLQYFLNAKFLNPQKDFLKDDFYIQFVKELNDSQYHLNFFQQLCFRLSNRISMRICNIFCRLFGKNLYLLES